MRDKNVKVIGGLRRALIGVAAVSALSLAIAGSASANYEAGLTAYEKGQHDQAIDIWERFAVAGDVRSKKVLGDVYSGKILEESRSSAVPLETDIGVNNVDALKWYTLAAYHDFTAYQRPTAEEVNARILAEQRLPDIRFRMSTAQVATAETQVAETFERGSPYDLYRLGDMYQRGSGVAKNNTRALVMYSLAKSRGVGEASIAYANLEKIMTSAEIDMAEEQAANWQPPLPVEHKGMTTQMADMDRLRKELEELRLEDALEAVSDIDVELLQRALKSLGLYYGSVDNAMGPATREAIRRFQYSRVATDTEMTPEDKEAVRTGVLSPRQTVELIEAAAENNHPMSQYVLGVMHVRGIGVRQDGQEAVYWLTEAGGDDLAIAHYALGVIYRDGTTGLNEVTPNKALAAQHFARGFALGYKPAGDALKLLEFEAPPRNNE